MTNLWQDLRLAARSLTKHRAFTIIAVVTLALGIGANAIVFSVARGLLLRPLPVADADRLVFVEHAGGYTQSFPAYRDFRDRNTTFAGMAGYRLSAMALGGGQGARRLWGYLATGNYFELLGIQPVIGRFFSSRDETGPGSAPFAVLSYDLWQGVFSGDPKIPGTVIRLNDRPYTVIGVTPAGFYGTETFLRPELWVPMAMQPSIESNNWLDARGPRNTLVIGRLREAVSREAAAADLTNISRALAAEHPDSDAPARMLLTRPGLYGNLLRGPGSAFIGGVMLLSGLVLLAACANLGSLLAARIIDRRREIGVRLALGASRLQILRQVGAEVLLVAGAGGAAALALAQLTLSAMGRWRAPLDLPVGFDVSPDLSVFAFAMAASLGSGAVAAVAATRRAWRVDPVVAMSGRPGIVFARGTWHSRELLLTGQVTLCAVLLVASVVSVRGLAAAASTPLGIQPDGAAVVVVDLALARYTRGQIQVFDDTLLAQARTLPGVTAAAIGSSLPLSGDSTTTSVWPESVAHPRPAEAIDALELSVTPGYFSAIGTRLVAGRDFTRADDRRVGSVAIVNQAFARRLLKPGAAVGQRFRANGGLTEVVGVVEDGKYTTLSEAPQPALFHPRTQFESSTVVLVLRSTRPIVDMLAQARRLVTQIDPRVPVLGQGTFRQAIALAFLPAQAATLALGVFGLLAIVLAVVGVYGIAAYAVSARRREIGIRVAMGAQSTDVLLAVLGRTGLAVATGSIAGLVLGVAAARILENVVYLATPRDPVVIAAVCVLLAVVGVCAALPPARRALAVDPAHTLREG